MSRTGKASSGPFIARMSASGPASVPLPLRHSKSVPCAAVRRRLCLPRHEFAHNDLPDVVNDGTDNGRPLPITQRYQHLGSERARSAVRRVSHSSLGDRGRDAELGFLRGMQLAGRSDRASYGGRCHTSSSSIMPLGTREILDNSRKRCARLEARIVA